MCENRGQIPQEAFGRMKVLAKYSVQKRLLQREDNSIIYYVYNYIISSNLYYDIYIGIIYYKLKAYYFNLLKIILWSNKWTLIFV